ncbi:MAG TPA: alkaline phosphatase PhoX [Candidatus Limnocylindrales bacterium]|nr:alkaline phosphatase PhoX [Candidatus Limnocylindrales bacterium]
MRLTNQPRRFARIGVCAGAAMLVAAAPVMAATPAKTGPSSSQSPYVVPIAPGVRTTSILTVGDSVGGYRLVGIPDGLGVIRGEDDEFRLLANHELGASVGIGRAHGGTGGAFVSQWSIDGEDLAVDAGSDLIRTIWFWNPTTGAYETRTGSAANLARLCSADLPEKSAFWDPRSRTGFNGRLFMSGEESGDEGRAFAHVATGASKGTSYELPALGNLSYENVVASPATGRKTVVIGLDDTTPGQVYVYVGTKQRTGSPIERAGLTGGSLYGVAVPSSPTVTKTVDGVAVQASVEDRTTGVGGASVPFALHAFGDVSAWTGARLQAESVKSGVTEFLRPEDGAWDPRNPDDFYFVTTDRFDTVQTPSTDGVANTPASQVGNSRLWRLRFADVKHPELGGTVTPLLDGTEGPQMMDNLTVDRAGNVLLQEDPGNQAYLARVWSYSIAADTVTPIAQHDPARFKPGVAGFLTQDEESSGIIDASRILGPGWFLATVQAHYPIAGELVEGGQLYAIYNPASDPHRGHRDH